MSKGICAQTLWGGKFVNLLIKTQFTAPKAALKFKTSRVVWVLCLV